METKGISGGPKAISQDDLNFNRNQVKPRKSTDQNYEQSDAALFNAGASVDLTQFLGGSEGQRSEIRAIEGESEAHKRLDIAV